MDFELTKKEKSAISALKILAKTWPDTLWLFSAGGSLLVMRKKDGQHALKNIGVDPGVDPEYIVTSIIGIDNDGGDF